jgi:tRNA (pseudouridine54-N1)-methyltransferase
MGGLRADGKLGQRSGRMRRFVIIGQTASASGDFRLDDIAGTSGRIDVLLRCVRAALLVSHGVRRAVVVDLVLRGGPGEPRVLRIDGDTSKFLRPDERSLAVLVQKALKADAQGGRSGFVSVRPGVSVRTGGLDEALAEIGDTRLFVLDPDGEDVRTLKDIGGTDAIFVLGDHLGLDAETRVRLKALGASPLRLGPVAIHADDAIAVLTNELDRREAQAP